MRSTTDRLQRRTRVPTSTETPSQRGSVAGRDGQGVNRENGSGSRASPGGRLGAPLPRVRRPLDQADRRSPRSLAGDGQGVLLRPDRGEGAGGQGPLPGGVPRLRRVHAAPQRQGGCLRVLQGLPPRRDRGEVDPRATARGDARVARAPLPASDVVRLGTEKQACGSTACAPRDYRLAAVSPGLSRRGGSILSAR